MGYALYGKRSRTSDIVLTHLCVDHDYRGRKIARQLVEGIVERNPHRAGIRLSCRKDYEGARDVATPGVFSASARSPAAAVIGCL